MSIISVCTLVALLLGALINPAMADDNGFFFNNNDDDNDFFDHHDNNDDNDFFDHHDNDNNDFDNNGDVSQEIGQESESGDVNITSDVSSSGDYAIQCVAPLQFGNTGNLQNGQGVLQYFSDADDIEFEGSSFEFSPSVETTCDQAVQQSAAASS
jgi:hypothetical protein